MELIAEGGLRSSFRWRTDVLEAYDGTEQRAKLSTLPRAMYAGAVFLEAADLAYLRGLLAADADAAFNLPLPFETTPSVNAITGTTITISPTYVDWNVVGRVIYVRRPDGTAYTTTINTVGGGGATLTVDDSPPAGTWPAGHTMITPIESVQLEEGQTLSRWPMAAGRWQFAARQATARALTGTGGTLTTYGGFDVLDRRPVMPILNEQLVAGVVFQDAGGAMSASSPWAIAKPRRQLDFAVIGPSQRQWWKAFLTARAGRLSTFLCPTWRNDLSLLTYTAGVASLTIDSTYVDYIGRWWPSLAHRKLQVEFADGTIYYRTISAATDLGAGVTELTVTAAMSGSPANVVALSLLELARIDVDELSIEWDGNMVGRISVPIVVVQG